MQKASYLPPQLNSFYCTVNSPLVNNLFQENIVESQSYLKDLHCDTQRRICQTCLKQSCLQSKTEMNLEVSMKQTQSSIISNHVETITDSNFDDGIFYENLLRVNAIEQNIWQANDPDCCGIKCYSTPSCLDYFSFRCEAYTSRHSNATEICLQGKTLKFTLNPEFDFSNGTYTCHVRYSPPKILYTIETWLTLKTQSLPKLIWSSSRLKYDIYLKNSGRYLGSRLNKLNNSSHNLERQLQKHGVLLLWDGSIYLEHQTDLPIWNDAIVHRSAEKEISLYQLKVLTDFGSEPPTLQRHREEKYVVVQIIFNNILCFLTFFVLMVLIDMNHSLLYTAVCLNGLTFKQIQHNELNNGSHKPSFYKHSIGKIGRLHPDIRVFNKRLETNCELNFTWRVTIVG
ncbi:hypothetical protein KSF78_0007409 [Schistosoma japonicum]|nr:hypothetical protein KSF78_0007409 [Schistosoma japonicum]